MDCDTEGVRLILRHILEQIEKAHPDL